MADRTCEHENVGLFTKVNDEWLCLRCWGAHLQEENGYLRVQLAHKTEALSALGEAHEALRKEHARDRRAMDDCGAFDD